MTELTQRNRHDREEHHFGVLPAALVELAEAIGTISAGSTIEVLLADIDARLLVLEGQAKVLGSFIIDAWVSM